MRGKPQGKNVMSASAMQGSHNQDEPSWQISS